MKKIKMKWAVALTALVSVFTLTSCFDSDDDGTRQVGGFVKVNNYFGTTLTNVTGFKYTPTPTSLATVESNGFKPEQTNIAYFLGTYNENEQNITEETTNLDVNLMVAVSLDATVEVVLSEGASNDSVNYAPIISLDNAALMQNSKIYKPWFFNNNTLILPIRYFMSKPNHYFTLCYYPEENKSGDTTLKLYLKHNNHEDKSIGYTSLDSYINYHFFAFDLTRVYSHYRMTIGGASELPETIEIVTVENPYAVELEGGQADTKTYTVKREVYTEE